jgi:hypothetical protein
VCCLLAQRIDSRLSTIAFEIWRRRSTGSLGLWNPLRLNLGVDIIGLASRGSRVRDLVFRYRALAALQVNCIAK